MNSISIKNRRGFLFSVSVIMLLLPLIMFISLYKQMPETEMKDTAARLRCDKLHYFVEDIKGDMSRALEISTIRALAAAVEEVTETGAGLENYTFNCSLNCEFNCSEFSYRMNGSTAALTELILCGTINGENQSLMKNHTFTRWFNKILNYSSRMHYNVTFSVLSMELGHRDAWGIYGNPIIRLGVMDTNGMCFYEGVNKDINANTSIIGLQDPLYPMHTNRFVWKTIVNCPIENLVTEQIAGCSGSNISKGSVTGDVIFKDDIGNKCDIRDYCENTPPEELAKQILVIQTGFGLGTCVCGTDDFSWCFNASNESHFGGVIDYGSNNLASMIYKCNVTIPWIIETGDIDDDPPENPPRETGCGANESLNITDNLCIYIHTNNDCGIHEVGLGINSSDIRTECYTVSDINETYNILCSPGSRRRNGPSFLDRLDGRLNLSDKYVEQTRRRYNTTLIGIETLIDIFRIKDHDSSPVIGELLNERKKSSWVDYLFWQHAYGSPVLGSCEDETDYTFRLDCPHVFKYGVDTEQISTVCCPSSLSIISCKTCSGPLCNLTYILNPVNRRGFSTNISANPAIDVRYDIPPGADSSGGMTKTGFGTYNYTIYDVKGNRNASAEILVDILGVCPAISNSTPSTNVSDMPSC